MAYVPLQMTATHSRQIRINLLESQGTQSKVLGAWGLGARPVIF